MSYQELGVKGTSERERYKYLGKKVAEKLFPLVGVTPEDRESILFCVPVDDPYFYTAEGIDNFSKFTFNTGEFEVSKVACSFDSMDPEAFQFDICGFGLIYSEFITFGETQICYSFKARNGALLFKDVSVLGSPDHRMGGVEFKISRETKIDALQIADDTIDFLISDYLRMVAQS